MTIKQELQQAFEQGLYETIDKLILEYLEEYQDDYDRYSFLVNYYIYKQDLEKAKMWGYLAVKDNPHSLEAYYNYAYVNECIGNIGDAYENYSKLWLLQTVRKKEIVDNNDILNKMHEIEDIAEQQKENGSRVLHNVVQLSKNNINNAAKDPFSIPNIDIIGTTFFDDIGKTYYVGRYNDWYGTNWDNEAKLDVYHSIVELFAVKSIGNSIKIERDDEYMLPVLPNMECDEKFNVMCIEQNNEKYFYNAFGKKTFNYLRLKGNTLIASDKNMVFGDIIPLKQDKNKKKLVLNIFIDSFNWCVFNREGNTDDALEEMKRIMPNTYEFFKDSIICSKAYTNSEWTTPSLSTYWTGVDSNVHMNLENDVWWAFDRNRKLLSEYFQEDGYMTACINGNNSCTPAKGYMRGIQREVFQAGTYSKNKIVTDTIEQIEAFKECNQFVWIQFEDLHKIAGSFAPSIAVQMNNSIELLEIDNDIKTTVKQTRSLNREKILKNEIYNLDMYLGVIYDYINKNYNSDEIIVSLFSDHGTAFMVDNDQPIMCEQRVHVPMLFRCDSYKGIIDEYIQNMDYSRIMCKLAGINYNEEGTDSNLPEFLGGKRREYAFAHSIFKGDPYQAVIIDDEDTFYYKSEEEVNTEMRFSPANHRSWLINSDKEEISNDDKIKKYEKIVYDKVKKLMIIE